MNSYRTEHETEIRRMPGSLFDRLAQVSVITWRPGDQTDNFAGNKFLVPAVKATMFALSYLRMPRSRHLPFRTYTAQPDAMGNLCLGGWSPLLRDGAEIPTIGARRRAIDPAKNPSALYLLMRMHKAARRNITASGYLPAPEALTMPLALVGYEQQPECFMSEALEQLTRKYRGWQSTNDVPRQELREAMRERWNMLVRSPRSAANPTGLWLVDKRVSATPGVDTWLDFRGLLGVTVLNPARELASLRIANPAGACLREIGIDPGAAATDLLNGLEEDQCSRLLGRMRELLGEDARHFDDDTLAEAILQPAATLRITSRSVVAQLENLGEERVFGEMRAQLPQPWSDIVTDEELKTACYDCGAPLIIKGACRPQVVALPSCDPDSFKFTAGVFLCDLWPRVTWGWGQYEKVVGNNEATPGRVASGV